MINLGALNLLNVLLIIFHSLISSIFVSLGYEKYVDEKSILCKESLEKIRNFKLPHFFKSLYLIFSLDILYVLIKLDNTLISNIMFLQYLLLIPLLLIAFYTDIKYRIIPNRVNLFVFEIAIITMFLVAIIEPALLANRIFGMVFASIIFLIMLYIGKILYKQKTIGYGDVKLISGLGLAFGFATIVDSILLAFIITAVILVGILIYRVICNIKDEYIPFAPFLISATIISVFMQDYLVVNMFFAFCDKISQIILKVLPL